MTTDQSEPRKSQLLDFVRVSAHSRSSARDGAGAIRAKIRKQVNECKEQKSVIESQLREVNEAGQIEFAKLLDRRLPISESHVQGAALKAKLSFLKSPLVEQIGSLEKAKRQLLRQLGELPQEDTGTHENDWKDRDAVQREILRCLREIKALLEVK